MANDNTDDLIISISTDQATLRRSIKRIETDLGVLAGTVKKQFDTVGKSIDNSITSTMQNRINGMVGIGTKAAKEWTGALADQGEELERLRAKYSPLFNTINNYKMAVSDIRRAHAIGAISANEMAAAISKERQAALASTAAIKGRNAALADTPTQRSGGSGGSYNTANLAAQFQDIAVTSAMGMSPLQIALQQGTQISAVLGPMGAAGAVKGLGAAFLSVISPVSLATIAFVAAGAAAIQYFSSMDWGSGKSEEALKKEAELIQRIVDKWGEALPELKKYADERQKLADGKDIKEAAAIEAAKQWDDLRTKVKNVNVEFADVITMLQNAGAETGQVIGLQRAFNDLSKGIKDGTATSEQAKTVQNALADFAKETGIPAISEFAKQFDELAKSIDASSIKAGKLKQEAAVLVDLMKGLPPLGTLNPMTAQDGRFMTDAMEQQNQRAIDAANADPTILSNGQYIPVPTPTARPNIELEGLPGDAAKKEQTAAEKAANAYRDLMKSADDRIGQMKQEIDLLGKFGVEADAARFALDLLQNSEDKGRSLSEEQRKELEKKVALYKQYSETLAKAKLSQDLLEERRLKGMSKTDQNVYQTLKEYGLPTNLDSDEAKKIRQAININDLSDGIHSFFTDFSSALQENGGDIGEAFAKSLKTAALNALNKSLEDIFARLSETLATALLGGGAGAGSGAGALGGVVAKALGTEISGKAPVGAVTRMALPDVGATTDIAAYISKAAAARGIDPSIALKVAKSEGGLNSWNLQSSYFKNGVQEPSFGPFQLYKGGGLGNDFMRKTGMDPALASSGPAGVDFALDHASKNGWGAWYGAAKVGVGKWDGIGANNASDAVNKMAESAGAATKGLDSMAGGLGKVGQQLSTSFFPAAPSAPGGGGLGGLFSGLFGGGGGANLSKYQGMVGLFAEGGVIRGPGSGTSDSIPTMLSDEEFIVNSRQSKKHRALLHAINNGTIGHMAAGGVARSIGAPVAPALAARRTAANDNANPGILLVQIVGASGDDHVRMLVKQGVGEGLQQYNKSQERGGFGTLQGRYNAQKG